MSSIPQQNARFSARHLIRAIAPRPPPRQGAAPLRPAGVTTVRSENQKIIPNGPVMARLRQLARGPRVHANGVRSSHPGCPEAGTRNHGKRRSAMRWAPDGPSAAGCLDDSYVVGDRVGEVLYPGTGDRLKGRK